MDKVLKSKIRENFLNFYHFSISEVRCAVPRQKLSGEISHVVIYHSALERIQTVSDLRTRVY